MVYRRLEPKEAPAYRQIYLESLKIFPDNFGTLHEDQAKVAKLQSGPTTLKSGDKYWDQRFMQLSKAKHLGTDAFTATSSIVSRRS